MSVRAAKTASLFSIAFPVIVTAVFAGGIAERLGYFDQNPVSSSFDAPTTVTVPPHDFAYRADGEFYKNGYTVDGPMVVARLSTPLEIMKFQVTEAEYGRCVAAGRCEPVQIAHVNGPDRPVTGVSYDAAVDYADWLSARTGQIWRLPSHEQIAAAAGRRFPDDALGVDPDNRNPAIRWLADYDRETRRKAASDPVPKPVGKFGENEYGLADFAGNVWEWTSTCHRRIELADADWAASSESVCGIFVTVGQHRSPMSSFVRDPKTGGCAVGTPPANLGFRLIRDDRWYAGLLKRLRDRGVIS